MEYGDIRTLYYACLVLFSFVLYQVSEKPWFLGVAAFIFMIWLDLRLN